MIKTQPYELQCTACEWRKTFAPASDALIPGKDHIEACPECGNNGLEYRLAGPVKGLLAEVRQRLKRSVKEL